MTKKPDLFDIPLSDLKPKTLCPKCGINIDSHDLYDIDPQKEATRLLQEAITQGTMTLRNGLQWELTPTQVLSICKRYVKSVEESDDEGQPLPSDMQKLLG